MKPLREQLQREAASLLTFVESVSHACVPPPQSVSYSESSTKFFEYIQHLAERTKQHIAGFDRYADSEPDEFVEARAELWSLRAAWREFH